MQKTKLGVSLGILGTAVYFSAFFSGWIALILLGGYILLFEENPWLKKCVIKAAILCLGFDLVINLVEIIPELMNMCYFLGQVFNKFIQYEKLTNVINFIKSGFMLLEKILFILLGIKAMHQGTIRLPIVDSLMDKYMDRIQEK